MSYHGTIFSNKEFRKHFSKEELLRLQLINIVGKPARRRGISRRGNVFTVFGPDFVAKVALMDRKTGSKQ